MKINKLFWIFGLIFALSSTSVFAFTLSDIYRNPYFIFFVNILIIWSILFAAQLFIITSQDTRVKIVAWIATLALAFLIVWNFTPRGAAYLWEAGWIAQYLKLTLLVNTIILAIVIFYLAGFLAILPQTPQGRIGLIIGSILLAGIIAYSLPAGKYIWEEENVQNLWKYLRGPEGILTLNPANIWESRLFIFITATILFAWFFMGFIPNLAQTSPKLTYIMAFIIGAQLARQGTTSGTLIGIGESFALLIIGGQVAQSFGRTWWGWIIGFTLVEWIFCAVFGQSRALQVLGEIAYAIGSSTFVSLAITFWFISLALRSPSWQVALAVIGGGLLLGIINRFTGANIGSAIRGLFNYNMCEVLARHTIVAAAAATGGAVPRTLSMFGINLPWNLPWWIDPLAGLFIWTSAGAIAYFIVYRGALRLLGRS